MRKGADCLSKWVGEAERQLRLLFEEARNSQPSIIFFDEIDGLAPVRSSKQDQIHASIVSTLLALMDGMDGRGQVVVIGATNRPDAVDPALRRPGRFDREFYFGLPSLEAREKILRIMTKGWEGWDVENGGENVKGLAKLTKGYGGADLRVSCFTYMLIEFGLMLLQALCTEAALNAVQRRYPQIYKSNDRLLLQPESIEVGLRDFMISIKSLHYHIYLTILYSLYFSQNWSLLPLVRRPPPHRHCRPNLYHCSSIRSRRSKRSLGKFYQLTRNLPLWRRPNGKRNLRRVHLSAK